MRRSTSVIVGGGDEPFGRDTPDDAHVVRVRSSDDDTCPTSGDDHTRVDTHGETTARGTEGVHRARSRVSLGAPEGTAAMAYRALVFTNTGGRTCTIQGWVCGCTPPHERKSVFVLFETTGCDGELPVRQLTVRTVHEGSGLV